MSEEKKRRPEDAPQEEPARAPAGETPQEDTGKKGDKPLTPGQQRRRQQSVFQYIAILFGAAFLLLSATPDARCTARIAEVLFPAPETVGASDAELARRFEADLVVRPEAARPSYATDAARRLVETLPLLGESVRRIVQDMN